MIVARTTGGPAYQETIEEIGEPVGVPVILKLSASSPSSVIRPGPPPLPMCLDQRHAQCGRRKDVHSSKIFDHVMSIPWIVCLQVERGTDQQDESELKWLLYGSNLLLPHFQRRRTRPMSTVLIQGIFQDYFWPF